MDEGLFIEIIIAIGSLKNVLSVTSIPLCLYGEKLNMEGGGHGEHFRCGQAFIIMILNKI